MNNKSSQRNRINFYLNKLGLNNQKRIKIRSYLLSNVTLKIKHKLSTENTTTTTPKNRNNQSFYLFFFR